MAHRAEIDDHAEFAWNTHHYLNEYVRFGDAKAGAVIAWASALLGVLFSRNQHHLFTQVRLSGDPHWEPTLLAVVSGLAFATLIVSFCLGVLAIRPNLRSSQEQGMIFWGNVRRHRNKTEYRQAFRDLSETQLINMLVEHNYDLACICNRKYAWINRAIFAASAGSVAAVSVVLYESLVS